MSDLDEPVGNPQRTPRECVRAHQPLVPRGSIDYASSSMAPLIACLAGKQSHCPVVVLATVSLCSVLAAGLRWSSPQCSLCARAHVPTRVRGPCGDSGWREVKHQPPTHFPCGNSLRDLVLEDRRVKSQRTFPFMVQPWFYSSWPCKGYSQSHFCVQFFKFYEGIFE
jgi:hypothetical protein